MGLDMYEIVSWFGEVNIFLVFAIAIVGFITLPWIVAKCMKWRASKLQATDEYGVRGTKESGEQSTRECDVLNVTTLSSELTTVTNWYRLGINLNLQKHELDKIQQSYVFMDQQNDQRMLQMLDKWLRCSPNATWEDIVSALEQMGENRAAENIRQKYHIKKRSKFKLASFPGLPRFFCSSVFVHGEGGGGGGGPRSLVRNSLYHLLHTSWLMGNAPHTSTSRPPDVIHVMGVPRPSLFFAPKPKNKKTGEAWERG